MEKHIPDFGPFHIRPLRIPEDIIPLHAWVNQDYARYWGLLGASVERVQATYVELIEQNTRVYMGFHHEKPAFLIELYDPRQSPLTEHYAAAEGDLGMHILIAPPVQPISHFTHTVFKLVMEFMFSDPKVQRIVVEPDHRNQKIHRLNKRAGFQHVKQVQLGEKTALLAFCTRADFAAAVHAEQHSEPLFQALHDQPELAAGALDAKTWALVNRQLVRKAISELAHELLIEPECMEMQGPWGYYVLKAGNGSIQYRFRARIMQLDHWHIDEYSIVKTANQLEQPLDAARFIIEFRKALNIKASMLPTYLEEIISTLSSRAYKSQERHKSARELLKADFQAVETAMMEGHPCFLANSGRIGFDVQDFHAYTPEAGSPVRLVWVAAHRSRATFASSNTLCYDELIEQELDLATREAFAGRLRDAGVDPADYILMPVHPWQWSNKIAHIYAGEIASQHLICLGRGDDYHLPQQSIRTFFNVSHADKYYVKTALSILNMGFMRGLSAAYMRSTPAINDWAYELLTGDPYLSSKGFRLLREIASVGYQHPLYENDEVDGGAYKKMLAALWRESPVPLIQPKQKLMTMASLLYIDNQGRALLPELIQDSGLSARAWLQRYLDVYMSPILHCYFKYEMVFMPHGENLIMVMENSVPVASFMKDIGEEVCLLNSKRELPPEVHRIKARMSTDVAVLSIFTDLFDCIFRFMGPIFDEQTDVSETQFWEAVARCVHDYQQAHPELIARYIEHDLFRRDFHRSCLNRLQLTNNQQMIDLSDPAKNLQLIGTLKNPIAPYRTKRP